MKLRNGVNRKDIYDNSLVHYSYLQDSPEIREILKANGLLANREELPRNIRGKKPRDLRHEKKLEDSDDDDFLEKVSVINQANPDSGDESDQEEVRLEKIRQGKIDELHNDFRLSTSPSLNDKQRLAFYRDPDYCFVTTKEMLPILKMELDSLLREKGVYYSVFDKKDD